MPMCVKCNGSGRRKGEWLSLASAVAQDGLSYLSGMECESCEGSGGWTDIEKAEHQDPGVERARRNLTLNDLRAFISTLADEPKSKD